MEYLKAILEEMGPPLNMIVPIEEFGVKCKDVRLFSNPDFTRLDGLVVKVV